MPATAKKPTKKPSGPLRVGRRRVSRKPSTKKEHPEHHSPVNSFYEPEGFRLAREEAERLNKEFEKNAIPEGNEIRKEQIKRKAHSKVANEEKHPTLLRTTSKKSKAAGRNNQPAGKMRGVHD